MTSLNEASLRQFTDEDLSALLLIRNFELSLLRLFEQGVIHGTTHTCIGQEYIPVAISRLLLEEDYILSNHRGHGHYLARFHDPAGLLAEIMGRGGAICNGVGGSQHIFRKGYLSTGIQGQSLSIAIGIALHLQKRRQGIACAYIGDGTWGEGAVYEALNVSALRRLPLLVVVENNEIAQSTPVQVNMAGSIEGRVKSFEITHCRIVSTDISEIRETVYPLIDEVRSGKGPAVLEFMTHRVGPHSKGDDSRSDEELFRVSQEDWAPAYATRFEKQYTDIDAVEKERLAKIIQDVSTRAVSNWEIENE